MLASLVLSVTCLAFADDVPATKPSPPAARPHQPESEDLVRRALKAEAEGRDNERLTHLARAVALDPANSLARALMGLVEYRGRWIRPEAVAKSSDSERLARLREYLTRRAATPMKADAQVHLADWCRKSGLDEQARAHYRAAVQIDPAKETAWRHLGYEKKGNRWVRPEDDAAEKAEADAQRKADRFWRPRLERIREGLVSKDANRRENSERELKEIKDPRAVPMIISLLTKVERHQQASVQVLEQIEGPGASQGLVMLATFSPFETVRNRAASALLSRDPREVIGPLISLIRRPLKYKVLAGDGPGTTGQLLVDGERFALERIYRFPSFQNMGHWIEVPILNPILDPIPQDPFIGQAISMWITNEVNLRAAEQLNLEGSIKREVAGREVARRNMDVQQRMDNDIQLIESVKTQIEVVNARTLPILRTLTGREDGPNPEAWRGWWADQLGLALASSPQSKPTYSDSVDLPDVTASIPLLSLQVYTFSLSCFAAGTQVLTAAGPRVIEAVQIGDLVLSQDVRTGTLSYRPVIATHRNPAVETLRIAAGGETIVATGIHRFWKAGGGWTMARDLKPGDRLRMAGTSGVVESIRPDARQPVYNLDVEANRNYFVGNRGLLVNDFGMVDPIEAPFDGLRSPESLAEKP